MADKPKYIERDYYPLDQIPTDTDNRNSRRLTMTKSQILAEIKKLAAARAALKKKN